MSKTELPTNRHGFTRNISAPRIAVPAGACDSHMHIVGPLVSYPFSDNRSFTPPEATWEDYRVTAAKLRLERCVIVQPSFYASDNACTLDAVSRSEGRARAVVVVEEDVTTATLRAMHERGARGVRAQMISKGGLSFDALESVSARIATFGWHLQLYLDSRDLPDLAGRLRRLPVPIVFDHMAQTLMSSGTDEPGFRILLDLLAGGRAWVKLSSAHFPPSSERARLLAQANPERILWGTDWPHVSYGGAVPDDGALLDALANWFPDEQLRTKALVSNPDRLYFQPA